MKIDRPGGNEYIQTIAGWFQTNTCNKGTIWRYSVYLLNGFAGGLRQILESDGSGNKVRARQGSARLPRSLEETNA